MSLINKIGNLFLPNKLPGVKSLVKGFDISIEKKEGVLLTSKPKDDPDATAQPASIDSYYEVTINVDGSNPEYPAEEKPWKHTYTVLNDGSGLGFTGGTSFIPAGSKWLKFELVEEFDDAKTPPIGKWMPPHHSVMLRAHYRDASGHKTNMAIGGWVRKSETETPEWKAAARSPVTYI